MIWEFSFCKGWWNDDMGRLTKMILPEIEKKEKELPKLIAPKINELLKESTQYGLLDWYNSYEPRMYNRTNNLLGVYSTAETTVNGNKITMKVDSSSMHDYPGFEIPPYEGYLQEPLDAATGFDFMFMNGEHGHGRWNMATTLSPYMYVDRDVADGFGGQAYDIIKQALGK